MNHSSLGASHRLQFFINCSSMGPFHRLQSSRNRLLQQGSPIVSHALLENLLQHGLISTDNSSYQKPAPVWVLHGLQLCSEHIHLLWPILVCTALLLFGQHKEILM